MGYERNDRRTGFGGGYGNDRDRDRDYRGPYQSRGRDDGRGDYGGRFDQGRRDYSGDPRGYDQDRGFFDRAGDEVRSWFGDEDAERRRRADDRYGQYEDRGRYSEQGNDRGYGARDFGYGRASGGYSEGQRGGRASQDHDPNYSSWRDRQMESFDRDYADYRREHQSRFDTEFGSWRQGRDSQRDLLRQVKEHQEVVGSDGQHVGTVDHVRGDQIELTKNDQNAGGRHHLIPSSWLKSVDDKVTLSKTADQAKQHWLDEARDNQGGQFGSGQNNLNRSFSGTY